MPPGCLPLAYIAPLHKRRALAGEVFPPMSMDGTALTLTLSAIIFLKGTGQKQRGLLLP